MKPSCWLKKKKRKKQTHAFLKLLLIILDTVHQMWNRCDSTNGTRGAWTLALVHVQYIPCKGPFGTGEKWLLRTASINANVLCQDWVCRWQYKLRYGKYSSSRLVLVASRKPGCYLFYLFFQDSVLLDSQHHLEISKITNRNLKM